MAKKYVQEIEAVLKQFPQRTSKQNPEAYIGGGQSKLRYIGLKVPHLQKAMRDGFSFTKVKSGKDAESAAKELAEIWDFVWWNSDCYEVMSLALAWFYDPKQRGILKAHWPRLKKWSERIDNWAHSDTLSGIYARLHEDHGRDIYPALKKWNASKNPWLRRISIVSLFYYSSQRKTYPAFSQVKVLLEPQLEFDHYYVQKGVGWTLREAGNVYPKETFAFMDRNLERISSHAFSAAIEKMSPTQRARLKKKRKSQRTTQIRRPV